MALCRYNVIMSTLYAEITWFKKGIACGPNTHNNVHDPFRPLGKKYGNWVYVCEYFKDVRERFVSKCYYKKCYKML